jgi:hypothetical protein
MGIEQPTIARAISRMERSGFVERTRGADRRLARLRLNVAIQAVGSAFRAPVDAVQWVITGYLLAFTTVIPLTGWAASGSAPSACGWPPCWCS